ncbi:hypothetical protein Btru_052397, partial [Bulinus truncatus]
IPLMSSEVMKEDCRQFLQQCLSPLDRNLAQNSCSTLRQAINCTVRGNCASDVELRILHVNSMQGFNNITCDTSDLFPKDCKSCLFSYVDTFISINETDSIQQCSVLHTYIKCQLGQCGKNREQMMAVKDEEFKRFNLTDCAIKSLNSNGLRPSTTLISVSADVLVAMVIRQVIATTE